MLYIQLRLVKGLKTLEDIVLHGVFGGDEDMRDSVRVLMMHIEKNKGKTLWITDGWDEISAVVGSPLYEIEHGGLMSQEEVVPKRARQFRQTQFWRSEDSRKQERNNTWMFFEKDERGKKKVLEVLRGCSRDVQKSSDSEDIVHAGDGG